MALRSSARDSRRRVSVEGESGRSSFDGNASKSLVSWLLPVSGTQWEGLDGDQLDQLMKWTVEGHLAWCVFPIDMV